MVVVVEMGVVMVKKVGDKRGAAAAILADPNLSQDQVQCQLLHQISDNTHTHSLQCLLLKVFVSQTTSRETFAFDI